MKTPVEVLCRGIPSEFAEYLSYTKNLKFDETPDYNMMRGLFTRCAKSEKFAYDGQFDWFLTKEQRQAMREGKQSDQQKSGASSQFKKKFQSAKTATDAIDSREESKEEVKVPATLEKS